MKMPKKIHVGGLTYKVEIDSEALNVEAINQGAVRGLYGCTDQESCTILLRKGHGMARRQEVLTHEVLHAINEFSGLATILGRAKDEEMCLLTAPILLTVIRQNRSLVDFLLAEQ